MQMLKAALQERNKTVEEVKHVINLWYSEGWNGDEEIKSLMEKICTKVINGVLNNLSKFNNGVSTYVLFLDSCRIIFDRSKFATLANSLIAALAKQDDQSYFSQLSHRFVKSLNAENRKVYDEAVSYPWERILEAKLFSEEELDAARLLIPVETDLIKNLTIFKRYLIVVLGLQDFWTGDPWKSVLKLKVWMKNILFKDKAWYVSQEVVSALKSGKESIRDVQKNAARESGVARPPASPVQPPAPPVEQKGVFVDSGLIPLNGVAFTMCWVEGSVLRAYDNQAIQAMSVWDPDGDLPVTRKGKQIEIDLRAGSLKTTNVTLPMLQAHLQIMKDSHARGFYTGPMLVWEMAGSKFTATPPFCGSVGNEYANCGPKKTALEPSAKSDLTLLFTCLQQYDKDNELWTKCLDEVSRGKTVDGFLQQIEEETSL